MDWSDKRLDEFSNRIDECFKQVDGRLGRIESDLRDLNVRFDRMQQTLILTNGGIIAALLGVIATQL